MDEKKVILWHHTVQYVTCAEAARAAVPSAELSYPANPWFCTNPTVPTYFLSVSLSCSRAGEKSLFPWRVQEDVVLCVCAFGVSPVRCLGSHTSKQHWALRSQHRKKARAKIYIVFSGWAELCWCRFLIIMDPITGIHKIWSWGRNYNNDHSPLPESWWGQGPNVSSQWVWGNSQSQIPQPPEKGAAQGYLWKWNREENQDIFLKNLNTYTIEGEKRHHFSLDI